MQTWLILQLSTKACKQALKLCFKKPADKFISGFFYACIVYSPHNFAYPGTPLLTRNNGTFAAIYGIPFASPARLTDVTVSRLISTLDIQSTALIQGTQDEDLKTDIETWSVNLFYDYSLNDNWMLRAHLSYYAHTPGLLDSPIDDYHQALGLNEGARPQLPQDQLEVSYQDSQGTNVLFAQRSQAIGDFSIQFARQLLNTALASQSLWFSIKLPTGDASRLQGSGHLDLAGWLSTRHLFSNVTVFTQAGLLYMSDTDVLPERHNNWAAFGNLGVGFIAWDKLELKAQLDLHSALYDSQLRFLGNSSQLSVGASYPINNAQQFDFVISEDIVHGRAPDILFQFALHSTF